MSDEVIEELWRIKGRNRARTPPMTLGGSPPISRAGDDRHATDPADRHSVNEMAERDKAVGSSIEGVS